MKCLGIAVVAIILALGIAGQADADTYHVFLNFYGGHAHVEHLDHVNHGALPDMYTFMNQQYDSLKQLLNAHPILKGLI